MSVAILGGGVLVFFANVYRHSAGQWDDAYITFRFAQHLAGGQGLVWNIGGERVEGFTSLLHVLLISLGIKLQVAPEVASVIIGLTAVLLSVTMMVVALRREFQGLHPVAAAAVALYLIDATTAIHSTSGLETQLFVVLLCAEYLAAARFVERPTPTVGVAMAVLACLSVLARPEGCLYAAALYAALAVHGVRLRPGDQRSEHLIWLAGSSVVLGLLGLTYAVWKYRYFGYLLPNPFYVKSNRVFLAGVPEVVGFLQHVLTWYGPLVAVAVIMGRLRGIPPRVCDLEGQTKVLLTLAPAALAIAYYSTIIHEVGGAHRFSYPVYFYLVLAVAALVPVAVPSRPTMRIAMGAVVIAYVAVPVLSQQSWRLAVMPPDGVTEYHWRIANALAETRLGPRATVITDAAGVIPYVSGFNQVDRVGLVDNFLSGRTMRSPAERERYIWSRGADVYVGYEPPATRGAAGPDDDARMTTPYVSHLMQRKLVLVEARIHVQDPVLLHARMRELRDHWRWLGEVEWPGFAWLGLKAFVYVRADSPHADRLVATLERIIARTPVEVDLHLVRRDADALR